MGSPLKRRGGDRPIHLRLGSRARVCSSSHARSRCGRMDPTVEGHPRLGASFLSVLVGPPPGTTTQRNSFHTRTVAGGPVHVVGSGTLSFSVVLIVVH